MKTQAAIKKLEKAGFTVTKREYGYGLVAKNPEKSHIIEFSGNNGGEDSVHCINVRRPNDNSDPMTDYHAGMWADNISQAIRFAK